MTFFPDGSPYSYLAEQAGSATQNIGWLDEAEPFERGSVDDAFIAKLRKLCRVRVNRTRGFHVCNLCGRPSNSGPPTPTTVAHPDGPFVVGSAEIRVYAPTGAIYAAPDMIIHYVEKHGYRPPDHFVQAVMRPGHIPR